MSGRHRKKNPKAAKITALVGTGLLISPATSYSASDATWDRVAQCESSNNWSINSGNGYSGGLQFLPSTWEEFGGREFADAAYQATREEQIQIAEKVLAVQGWNAWPVCSKKANATSESANTESQSTKTTEKTIPLPEASYTVISGDILSAIADDFDTTTSRLVELNQIENPDLIYPGDKINIR